MFNFLLSSVTPLPGMPLESNVAPSAVSHGGHSLVELFVHASLFVQIIMALLVIASIISWAVILSKGMLLRRLKRQATAFEDAFWSGIPLDTLYERHKSTPADPFAAVFVSGMQEVIPYWSRPSSVFAQDKRTFLEKRVMEVMNITYDREMEEIEERIPLLANIGSITPFVGLLGTVWGIMDSFQQIAVSQNTTLASVGPGIAEALFATGLGLIAAIPATMAYHMLSHRVAKYGASLDTFYRELFTVLSRHLDHEKGAGSS